MVDVQAVVIVASIVGTVVVGMRASKGIISFNDFALSRGFFGLFSLVATLVATSIGGGLIMGIAEKCFVKGISPLIGPLGFFVQLLLIGLVFAPRLHRYADALTVGDIIEKYYGAAAKVCVSVIWLFYCTGLIVVQTNVLSKLLATYTHLDHVWNVVIGTGMVILYCSYGGIRAVIKTDVIQCLIIVICLPLTLGIAIWTLGGFSVLVASLPVGKFSLTGNYSAIELFSMFSTFLLSGLLIPPNAQRIMMAKTAGMARTTYLLAALITYPLVIVGCLFGLTAYAFNPEITGAQAIPYLFNTVLPYWARPLAVSGLIAVVMSTADSYFHSGAVAIVHDVMKPLFGELLQPKSELKWMQIISWLMGLVVMSFGIFVKADIIDLAIYAFQFWGPMIVVPFVALLFGVVISRLGFFACFFSGLATIILWDLLDLTVYTAMTANIPGMVVNLVVFICFYIFERVSRRVVIC